MTGKATVPSDLLHRVEPRDAGLDFHKLPVAATARLCPPLGATREFRTTPAGLAALRPWLLDQSAEAVAMEGTGIYWEAPYAALESPGLRAGCFTPSKSGS